jgi:hypothetical protein
MNLSDVKPAIANRTAVTYNGISYYVTACVMRLCSGEWYYQLELHDLKVNSITIADLKKVNIESEDVK